MVPCTLPVNVGEVPSRNTGALLTPGALSLSLLSTSPIPPSLPGAPHSVAAAAKSAETASAVSMATPQPDGSLACAPLLAPSSESLLQGDGALLRGSARDRTVILSVRPPFNDYTSPAPFSILGAPRVHRAYLWRRVLSLRSTHTRGVLSHDRLCEISPKS